MSTEKTTLTHDERVALLFAKLQAKQAEVANAERPQYITAGFFRFSTRDEQIDIKTARDERKLVEILAFLKEREESFAKAATDLGVEASFTWLGFTTEDWFKDLKTRVSGLQIAKRRAELKDLEERVNAVMTPELRREMEMKALEATLLD